jgi:hypothetical protein
VEIALVEKRAACHADERDGGDRQREGTSETSIRLAPRLSRAQHHVPGGSNRHRWIKILGPCTASKK